MPLTIFSNDISTEKQSLSLTETDMPTCGDDDLVVKVHAIGLNPVDYKAARGGLLGTSGISFGWDCSGTVTQAGSNVKDFSVGDAVLFSGDVKRGGCAAEYVAVDARLVAKKPTELSFTEAASFPLVSVTAYEAIAEQMAVTEKSAPSSTLLVINGGGGVGSAAVQLAKHHFGIGTVIATAGRAVTKEWCQRNGADHVLDHHQPLGPQLEALKVQPNLVLCTVDLDGYYDQIVEFISPSGKIVSITLGDSSKIDVGKLFFPKRLTLAIELMFTKPYFGENIASQGEMLRTIASLFATKKLQSIVTVTKSGLTVDNLNEGLDALQAGKMHGKFVVNVIEE
uniref:Enoyl reductase (ER) domain-containing protein n=1 Tax=Sexangularia sp. CB-2014 TaxID=1486929 RepID=A0A7S1YEG0_9EUKA|mmetsp:Transcript_16039/g.50126  ORF Transcript_16039/g.50126 Transcript_16039/m.50126 type:complete len:339 (+) Transcript_16039:55-1071(+)